MTTKKRRASELYEDYWALTVGHTDYFSKGTVSYQILEHLVSFVENNNNILIKGDPRYEILQNEQKKFLQNLKTCLLVSFLAF